MEHYCALELPYPCTWSELRKSNGARSQASRPSGRPSRFSNLQMPNLKEQSCDSILQRQSEISAGRSFLCCPVVLPYPLACVPISILRLWPVLTSIQYGIISRRRNSTVGGQLRSTLVKLFVAQELSVGVISKNLLMRLVISQSSNNDASGTSRSSSHPFLSSLHETCYCTTGLLLMQVKPRPPASRRHWLILGCAELV